MTPKDIEIPTFPFDEEKFRTFKHLRASFSSYFNLVVVCSLLIAQELILAYFVKFSYTKLLICLSSILLVIIGWVLCYLKFVTLHKDSVTIANEGYAYAYMEKFVKIGSLFLNLNKVSSLKNEESDFTEYPEFIDKCNNLIPIIEDSVVYIISFTAGMMVIFRSTYGECGHLPTILTVAACNPENIYGWIPSDITAVTLIVPLFNKVLLKGASWFAIKLSMCMVVGMTLYAIVVTSSWKSLYLIILLVPFIIMLLYEMRRQNVKVYTLTESLLASLEDNKRMAEEMRLNEMKMMIGNVAHDLKTVRVCFLKLHV